MAETPTGAFGEPVFPGAKADLTLDGFVRYVTTAKFDEVAAFYERAIAGKKHLFSIRDEENGVVRLVLGAGIKYTEASWAAIVVMPAPPRGKKPGKGIHVIVTKKG